MNARSLEHPSGARGPLWGRSCRPPGLSPAGREHVWVQHPGLSRCAAIAILRPGPMLSRSLHTAHLRGLGHTLPRAPAPGRHWVRLESLATAQTTRQALPRWQAHSSAWTAHGKLLHIPEGPTASGKTPGARLLLCEGSGHPVCVCICPSTAVFHSPSVP